MGSADLQPMLEALKSVAVALKEDGVPFALAGGYAVYARGGRDSRHDVDFVILESDVSAARQALSARGIEVVDPPEDWLFKARVHEEQVDLIFRLAMGPVDAELLDRCDQLSVDSVLMPVMCATDLLVSKLRALTEHSCDLNPILALMRSLREQLDLPRVEAASEGYPFAEASLFLARRLSILPTPEPQEGKPTTGPLAHEGREHGA